MRNLEITLLLVVLANCQLGLGNRALKQLQQLNHHRLNLIRNRNWHRPLHWNSIWDLHEPNFHRHSAFSINRWPYHRIKDSIYYGDRDYRGPWSHLNNRDADDDPQRYVESRSQEGTKDADINERDIDDPGVWTHMEIRNGPEEQSRASRVMISTSWSGKGEDAKEGEPRGKVVRFVWTDSEPKEEVIKDNQAQESKTVKLKPRKESGITDEQRNQDEKKEAVIAEPSQSERGYAKEENASIENRENVNIAKDHLKEKDPGINPLEKQEEGNRVKEEIKDPLEVPVLESKMDENISKDSEAIKDIEEDKEKVIDAPIIQNKIEDSKDIENDKVVEAPVTREVDDSKIEDSKNPEKVEDNDANEGVTWSKTFSREDGGESKVTVTTNIIRDSKENRSNVVRMVWNSVGKKDVNEADSIKEEDLKMSDSPPKRRAGSLLENMRSRLNFPANGILENGIWINGIRMDDLNSAEEASVKSSDEK